MVPTYEGFETENGAYIYDIYIFKKAEVLNSVEALTAGH